MGPRSRLLKIGEEAQEVGLSGRMSFLEKMASELDVLSVTKKGEMGNQLRVRQVMLDMREDAKDAQPGAPTWEKQAEQYSLEIRNI